MEPQVRPAPHARVDPLAGARVLVIDDTEAQRYSVVRHLTRAGCDVTEGATAAEALSLSQLGLDLVVLDVNLPDGSGLSVARELKARADTAHLPILQVSSDRVSPADRVAGLDGGADRYLVHPVDPDELLATARGLVRLAQVERALRQRTAVAEESLAALAVSETLLRTIQESSLSGFGLHRPVREDNGANGTIVDFDITYVNPSGALLMGRTPEGLIGRRMLEAFPGVLVDGIFASYVTVVESGTPFVQELEYRHEGVDVALALSVVRVGTGADLQLAVTFTDITARVHADAELAHLHAETHAARLEADVARAAADVARHAADAASAAAEQANQEKSAFLTHMSHELRTPLNAILGYTQLLELGVHGPVTTDQGATLGRIVTVQRHMLGLVNDVLEFATLSAGRVEYDVQETDVAEVVAEVLLMIEPQRAAKALVLDVDLSPASLAPGANGDVALRVWADRAKLVQVLVNVLANAVKFTPANGGIAVRHAVRSGEPPARDVTFLRIADTGIGIPPDQLEAIFDPFVQAHRATARAVNAGRGSGLGLAISRGLVRGMGGELRVRSMVGAGSAFTVSLPSVWRAVDGEERRDGLERRTEPDRRTEVTPLGEVALRLQELA